MIISERISKSSTDINSLFETLFRLYNGSWVFSAISENVQVTLQCPDGNIPTSLMGFGIVGLAEGCTISNDEFWYPHTFAGAMELNINFGDKGWETSEFHTDLLEGQDDFLEFPDDEYSDDLEAVANMDAAIIIQPEQKATARSTDSILDEFTTTLSSTISAELDSESPDVSTEVSNALSTSEVSTSEASTTKEDQETSGSGSEPKEQNTPIFQV